MYTTCMYTTMHVYNMHAYNMHAYNMHAYNMHTYIAYTSLFGRQHALHTEKSPSDSFQNKHNRTVVIVVLIRGTLRQLHLLQK